MKKAAKRPLFSFGLSKQHYAWFAEPVEIRACVDFSKFSRAGL